MANKSNSFATIFNPDKWRLPQKFQPNLCEEKEFTKYATTALILGIIAAFGFFIPPLFAYVGLSLSNTIKKSMIENGHIETWTEWPFGGPVNKSGLEMTVDWAVALCKVSLVCFLLTAIFYIYWIVNLINN